MTKKHNRYATSTNTNTQKIIVFRKHFKTQLSQRTSGQILCKTYNDLYCEDCKKITEHKLGYFTKKCTICTLEEDIK